MRDHTGTIWETPNVVKMRPTEHRGTPLKPFDISQGICYSKYLKHVFQFREKKTLSRNRVLQKWLKCINLNVRISAEEIVHTWMYEFMFAEFELLFLFGNYL